LLKKYRVCYLRFNYVQSYPSLYSWFFLLSFPKESGDDIDDLIDCELYVDDSPQQFGGLR